MCFSASVILSLAFLLWWLIRISHSPPPTGYNFNWGTRASSKVRLNLIYLIRWSYKSILLVHEPSKIVDVGKNYAPRDFIRDEKFVDRNTWRNWITCSFEKNWTCNRSLILFTAIERIKQCAVGKTGQHAKMYPRNLLRPPLSSSRGTLMGWLYPSTHVHSELENLMIDSLNSVVLSHFFNLEILVVRRWAASLFRPCFHIIHVCIRSIVGRSTR